MVIFLKILDRSDVQYKKKRHVTAYLVMSLLGNTISSKYYARKILIELLKRLLIKNKIKKNV